MSDEKEERPEATSDVREASDDGEARGASIESAAEDEAPRRERVDADGLPIDREPTIDDVRSTSGVHGRFALGCTIVIVVLILAFWFIRAGIGG